MTTAIDIAREFFLDASDGDLGYILWNETGFPCFWPDASKSPEANLRMQLAALKDNIGANNAPTP